MRNNCKTKIIIDINLLLDKADPAKPNCKLQTSNSEARVNIQAQLCTQMHTKRDGIPTVQNFYFAGNLDLN